MGHPRKLAVVGAGLVGQRHIAAIGQVPGVELAAVSDSISRLVEMGVPAGVMALDPDVADRYLGLGASFVAVAVDLMLLADAAAGIRKRFP